MNTKEHVALRTVAAEWAAHLHDEPKDPHDRAFKKLDNKLMKAAGKISGMAKRGYSRDFKPHGETGKRYLLDQIPAGLWSAVRDKCKREGVSVRAQILKLLKEWIDA